MAADTHRCPALRDYDPFDPEHLADPYPLWRLSQREAPVFHVAGAGFWAVTGYDEVLEVARDTATLTGGRPPHVWSQRSIRAFRPTVHRRPGVGSSRAMFRRIVILLLAAAGLAALLAAVELDASGVVGAVVLVALVFAGVALYERTPDRRR